MGIVDQSLLLAGAIGFLFLSLHPFVSYPVSLWILKQAKGSNWSASQTSDVDYTFTICVCAYNEEKIIVEKAKNLLAIASKVNRCEILIYVDGKTDKTAELLVPYADRIRVFVGNERRGKSYGMSLLTRMATGDILVFTDANVMVDEQALPLIGSRFLDPQIGCVSGHLVYSNPDETAMSSSGSLYWRIEEAIKRLESDAYNVIGADGSLFAVRRSLYKPAPDDIIDDFYVSMQVLIDGYRSVSEPRAIAFERTATGMTDEFRRKVRIACQAFNVHRVIWHQIWRKPMLAYCYVSHRLLKWLIGVNLFIFALFMTAFAMEVANPLLVIGAELGMAALFALALFFRLRIAEQILSILLSFAGAAWGVWRSIRGDRFQTWTPQASAREPMVD